MGETGSIVTPARRSRKRTISVSGSGRNHLKVKSNQREYECFQILYKIVEDTKTLGIVGLLHVDQGTDFSGLCCGIERDISFVFFYSRGQDRRREELDC